MVKIRKFCYSVTDSVVIWEKIILWIRHHCKLFSLTVWPDVAIFSPMWQFTEVLGDKAFAWNCQIFWQLFWRFFNKAKILIFWLLKTAFDIDIWSSKTSFDADSLGIAKWAYYCGALCCGDKFGNFSPKGKSCQDQTWI